MARNRELLLCAHECFVAEVPRNQQSWAKNSSSRFLATAVCSHVMFDTFSFPVKILVSVLTNS